MKKRFALLLVLVCLLNFTGCAYMTYGHKDDGIQTVLVKTNGESKALSSRDDWEDLVTMLMKDADIDGKGRDAESNYTDDACVAITIQDAVYTYYVDWEGNIVRVLNGKAMEVYNTKLAEDILQEMKRLLP